MVTQRPSGRLGYSATHLMDPNLQACPYCQRNYQRGISLREHIRYCQDRHQGPMVCPLCDYSTTYREQMEQHMAQRNHTQDKHPVSDHSMENRKFKCLQCGKAFKYKHHLKEHLRIHSGEKPYECNNCKKRFSHSGSYSSHLSSKKCLNGGGGGGGGGIYNGHSQVPYHPLSPTSPSADGGRNYDKGSPYRHLLVGEANNLSPQNLHSSMGIPRGSGALDLARLWDPAAELSLRASVFKGTTLLPHLYSGAKFEQILQDMLHQELKRDQEREGERGEGGEGGVGGPEDGRRSHNGGGRDGMASPEGRATEGERSGERERDGVTCRWCSQLFPNSAVLLQHQRYLCRRNKEVTRDVPEGPHHEKDQRSPSLLFRQLDNHKPTGSSNGLAKDTSALARPNWHSVPQQILVAMHSPQPRPDLQSLRPYWPNRESGSPGQPISPEMTSPPSRRRVASSGFGSPLCLDLSACPPDLSSPQNRAAVRSQTPGSAGSQNEPLDLSLPKQLSDQEGNDGKTNGINPAQRGEKRQLENNHLPHRRLSPTQSPQLKAPHPYSIYRELAGVPRYRGGSMYSGFPLLNPLLQSGFGGPGHDDVPPMPLSRQANSPGFLSPMAFMMETDMDPVLKRIHQERQAIVGEVLSRRGLDYLSLMDEGVDGEGGQGRKRLKKTEEGLYACDICDKTFQKSSSLLRHKYEHTGKRPHECKICSKAFKHKHHLIEHSRLHSGEKPYQCDKCGKRFSHSGSYSQHMNHRYAFCNRDQQDPDQDPEELPLTPGTLTDLGGRLAEGTPFSMEDTQAPSFLSDSSLDGGVREEDNEEEEEEEGERSGDRRSLDKAQDASGSAGEGLGLGSPLRSNGEQGERRGGEVHHEGTESTEKHHWEGGRAEPNGDTQTRISAPLQRNPLPLSNKKDCGIVQV
ncbi:zinc finger E-box-binding homeobox 2 [Aplochiton taeniatus]